MKVFITGICGFVGRALAEALREFREGMSIFGLDNLQRPSSEMNRGVLRSLSVRVVHGDIRATSDLESLPPADWVIVAALQTPESASDCISQVHQKFRESGSARPARTTVGFRSIECQPP